MLEEGSQVIESSLAISSSLGSEHILLLPLARVTGQALILPVIVQYRLELSGQVRLSRSE